MAQELMQQQGTQPPGQQQSTQPPVPARQMPQPPTMQSQSSQSSLASGGYGRQPMSLPATGAVTPNAPMMTPSACNNMSTIQQVSTFPGTNPMYQQGAGMSSQHEPNGMYQQGPQSAQDSSESVTLGPHYEVTPFNYDSYNESKEKEKLEIPNLGIDAFAPPPSHKDRGANMRPKRTITSNSSTGSLPQSNRTVASLKQQAATPSGAPGGLPPRDASSTPNLPSQPTLETTVTNESEMSSESLVSETGSNDPPKAAVLGAYHEPTTTFAPPPKPHSNFAPRNPVSQARGGPPSLPPLQKRASTASSTGAPAPAALPPRTTPTKPVSTPARKNEAEQPRAAVLGAYTSKPVDFAPPPKPFRHVEQTEDKSRGSNTSNRGSSISSEAGAPAPLSRSSTTGSIPPSTAERAPPASFQPPPQPYRRTSEVSEVDPVAAKKKGPPPVVGRKPSAAAIEARAGRAPPPIKPKKSGLFDANSQNSSTSSLGRRSTMPTPGGAKQPPPAVKPKPKALSRTNTNINPMSEIANELSSVHLRHTGGPVAQNPGDDSNANPFAIYKKDAVPQSEDRIRNR